ncbi:MAG: hypothetical protein IPI07_17765 [Flavobacteriales bacterium]|nr:hypothetical protein [Flavobacteriales bacterium]
MAGDFGRHLPDTLTSVKAGPDHHPHRNAARTLGRSAPHSATPAPGPGIYTDTLTTAAGCDSIITIDLSVVAVINASVSDTICSGQSYTLPGGTVV